METLDKEKIEEIAKKHGLKLLLLFGSQASGKTHKFSDFDFGFISKKELSYLDRSVLVHDLAGLVKNSKVEDVDLMKAGPFLLREIIRNNKLLFEQEYAYADFYSRAVRTYFEAKPFFELQSEIYAKNIKQLRKTYAQ